MSLGYNDDKFYYLLYPYPKVLIKTNVQKNGIIWKEKPFLDGTGHVKGAKNWYVSMFYIPLVSKLCCYEYYDTTVKTPWRERRGCPSLNINMWPKWYFTYWDWIISWFIKLSNLFILSFIYFDPSFDVDRDDIVLVPIWDDAMGVCFLLCSS